MLTSLSIRDVVLIDRLDLNFDRGLCVLTGETGAGKSILLDALGLALGWRADLGLIREGTDLASVTASFELPKGHLALALLDEQGIEEDGELILRRQLNRDGRSRAFANDRPVSAGLLRRLGESLIEIHGQHDERGLLDPVSHRALLDAYAGNDAERDAVKRVYDSLKAAESALERAEQELARARAEEEYLRHVAGELTELAPEPGEDERLAQTRQDLMAAEKIGGILEEAYDLIEGDGGASAKLAAALRKLDRGGAASREVLKPALEILTRALMDVGEAGSELDQLRRRLNFDAGQLERCEERLFRLRAAARKHNVTVDALPALAEDFQKRLEALETGATNVSNQARDVSALRAQYADAAAALGDARRRAAVKLDAAVQKELKPLKLESARFRTLIEGLNEIGPEGLERVQFEVATNPGASFGALSRIASGGELARFVLALKVALIRQGTAETLIFDEVDHGIGGAVAAAVGARLSLLSARAQILVVTHSPQVAARGSRHWRILKRVVDGRAATRVEALGDRERQEEIARMIAGSRITNEARAAAKALLEGDGA